MGIHREVVKEYIQDYILSEELDFNDLLGMLTEIANERAQEILDNYHREHSNLTPAVEKQSAQAKDIANLISVCNTQVSALLKKKKKAKQCFCGRSPCTC